MGFISEMAGNGNVYLYYGVHYSNNYLYKNTLEELSGLHCYIAGSRDVPSLHVQDKLREKQEEVALLLEKKAVVLVCGTRKFVGSIEKYLLETIGSDAKAILEEMKQSKRFLWESWGE